jgi:phosphotransferase system  glucose/maltose/N-acetylglucosamine-specific IIC component
MFGLIVSLLLYASGSSSVVPFAILDPFILALLRCVALFIVLGIAVAVAWYAKKRGRSFWAMLVLGVLVSPTVQIIVLLILLGRFGDARSAASR